MMRAITVSPGTPGSARLNEVDEPVPEDDELRQRRAPPLRARGDDIKVVIELA